MSTIWQGVDQHEADARLRSLNRRLRDLGEALRSLALMLEASPESLAYKHEREGLLERQGILQDELATLMRHAVKATVDAQIAPKSTL